MAIIINYVLNKAGVMSENGPIDVLQGQALAINQHIEETKPISPN